MTWLIVVFVGHTLSAQAPSPEACATGAENIHAWAASQRLWPKVIQCVTSDERPKGTRDLFEWLNKGDA